MGFHHKNTGYHRFLGLTPQAELLRVIEPEKYKEKRTKPDHPTLVPRAADLTAQHAFLEGVMISQK